MEVMCSYLLFLLIDYLQATENELEKLELSSHLIGNGISQNDWCREWVCTQNVPKLDFGVNVRL
jgi:hypothetical protein